MNKQLEQWQGELGNKYTSDSWSSQGKTSIDAWARMLDGLSLSRILEVGCGHGRHLSALYSLYINQFNDMEIVGIDPNRLALTLAKNREGLFSVLKGNAYDIPFKDDYFDLVFTCAVLIHIPSERLQEVLKELYRVSNQYILTIEPSSDLEEMKLWRGQEDMVWVHDLDRRFKEYLPGLSLVRWGRWDKESGLSGWPALETTPWRLYKKEG